MAGRCSSASSTSGDRVASSGPLWPRLVRRIVARTHGKIIKKQPRIVTRWLSVATAIPVESCSARGSSTGIPVGVRTRKNDWFVADASTGSSATSHSRCATPCSALCPCSPRSLFDDSFVPQPSVAWTIREIGRLHPLLVSPGPLSDPLVHSGSCCSTAGISLCSPESCRDRPQGAKGACGSNPANERLSSRNHMSVSWHYCFSFEFPASDCWHVRAGLSAAV